eukprot:5964276-Prymnesium_polylepis.2
MPTHTHVGALPSELPNTRRPTSPRLSKPPLFLPVLFCERHLRSQRSRPSRTSTRPCASTGRSSPRRACTPTAPTTTTCHRRSATRGSTVADDPSPPRSARTPPRCATERGLDGRIGVSVSLFKLSGATVYVLCMLAA